MPPVNHLANGGLDQSRTWSQGASQVSRCACRSQKARRSASASAYTSALTFAVAANSGGGGNRRDSCRGLERGCSVNAELRSLCGNAIVIHRHANPGGLVRRKVRSGVDQHRPVAGRPPDPPPPPIPLPPPLGPP